MSKIEKALKKFKEESRKGADKAVPEVDSLRRTDSQQQASQHASPSENTTSVRTEIPAREEVENFPQQSASNDTVNGYLTEHLLQSLKDQEATKRESHIVTAIDKNENESNALFDFLSEHDTHDQSTSDNEIAPPTQETIGDKHVAEDVIPSTKIDTYDVDDHIVSYYDTIKEQTWKGPVMVHFRRLQVSLANMQKNNMCKVMLFTSSTQKEGKSTIAMNTAIILCGGKKNKVVIVDCDFRKPTVNKLLGFDLEKGLSDYLAEKAEIKDIAINGFVPGLTIIPVCNKPPNACELLASDRMKQFVSYLKERFDYVIIDTPPVLAFPDTSILAPLSDGVVFVINCKKIKKSIVKRAVETLHDCKIIGVVMNQSESAAVDYYGYTSGYAYYDYGSS